MTQHSYLLGRRTFLGQAVSTSFVLGITTSCFADQLGLIKSYKDSSLANDPHYFLTVAIPNGVDATYLFDARPLEMTVANLQVNYLGEDPTLWQDSKGGSTLVTSLVKPLEKWRSNFSIINGVVMSTLDGHEQNMNAFLTGNPFGGDMILPIHSTEKFPIGFIQTGPMYGTTITNSALGLTMSPDQCKQLSKSAANFASAGHPITRSLLRLTQSKTGGNGRLSHSARNLSQAIGMAPDMAQKFSKLDFDIPTGNQPSEDEKFTNNIKANVNMIAATFLNELTRSALLEMNPGDLDTHGPQDAKDLPIVMKRLALGLSAIFEALANIEHSEGRSMLDCTTIVISSEFSRTMRQPGLAIDKSGTDHNGLSNTILVGGKGIQGGLILGETDYRTPDEELSQAHLSLDGQKVRRMGKPFDFAKEEHTNSHLTEYSPYSYLSPNNITNTLQEILKIDRKHRFKFGRETPNASVLKKLIKA
ncbi:MAG: DUF1501 domain-containing protein [Proteobacteria bacterium]|nr:DUF1501 domain-containing protein [Pseudomonadota bacterium]